MGALQTRLTAREDALASRASVAQTGTVTEAERARLRALGYAD